MWSISEAEVLPTLGGFRIIGNKPLLYISEINSVLTRLLLLDNKSMLKSPCSKISASPNSTLKLYKILFNSSINNLTFAFGGR